MHIYEIDIVYAILRNNGYTILEDYNDRGIGLFEVFKEDFINDTTTQYTAEAFQRIIVNTSMQYLYQIDENTEQEIYKARNTIAVLAIKYWPDLFRYFTLSSKTDSDFNILTANRKIKI